MRTSPTHLRVLTTWAVLLSVSLLPARAQSPSQLQPQTQTAPDPAAQLNSGVLAFKAAHYDEAADHFRQVLKSQPDNEQAHQYLGATLAAQVLPNLDTPENLQLATDAIAEFDAYMKNHPGDLNSLKQQAAIYRNIGDLDRAKAVAKRIVAINANDATALYTIGVIDWTLAYNNAVTVLGQESLQDDGKGNATMSPSACQTIRAQNAVLIDDALTSLVRALQLQPSYADAMQYLNLVYRRRADLHCTDPAQRTADLKQADNWQQKATQTQKPTPTPTTP